jgi:steroid delta-isomerase-like uncharacterized protein
MSRIEYRVIDDELRRRLRLLAIGLPIAEPGHYGRRMSTPFAISQAGATTPPSEIARQLFAALNTRDFDCLSRLGHEDVVDDFVVLGEVRGRAAVLKFFEELLGAFPDFRIDVARVTSAGEVAVVEWKAEGTFTGSPFQGILATGRRVRVRGVDCMRFEDGRLKHNTIYYDGASFARAIGLLPAQGSGAEKGMSAAFNALTKLRRAAGGLFGRTGRGR